LRNASSYCVLNVLLTLRQSFDQFKKRLGGAYQFRIRRGIISLQFLSQGLLSSGRLRLGFQLRDRIGDFGLTSEFLVEQSLQPTIAIADGLFGRLRLNLFAQIVCLVG
jgi:hypothetical protein